MKYKVTLDSGKECVFRKLNIRDYQLSAEAGGKGANPTVIQLNIQNELIKNSLVSVNGKELKGSEKEDLDSLFDITDYSQIKLFVEETLGNVSKPKVEVIAGS